MASRDSAGDSALCLRFFRLRRVELAIIRVFWDRGVPLTAREVFEALHQRGRWSYLTVRTTMTRMVEAGVLEQERKGRSNFYEPTVDRQAVAAACVEKILSEVIGGELGHGMLAVLRHLPLSAAARQTVRRSVLDTVTPGRSESAGSAGGVSDSARDVPISSMPAL